MLPPIFHPLPDMDPGPVAAWFGVVLSMAILLWVALVECRESARIAAEPPPPSVDSYYGGGR